MTAPTTAVLEEIARRHEEFSISERSVADLVLTLPDLPLTTSMRALARRAGVSDATVLRFCRFLGFKGYSDFKLSVARSVGLPSADSAGESIPTRSSERALALAARILRHVEEVVAADNLKEVDRIAERIEKSDIVYLFAFGASTVAAGAFVHRMHYLGLKASVLSDPHLQALRIAGMTKKSVALFLSIGYSRLLSEMAEVAKETGAYTVAVATPGTPLSSACHSSITMTKDVGGVSGPPVQGRYLQLVILDTIAEQIAAARHRDREPESDIEARLHFNY